MVPRVSEAPVFLTPELLEGCVIEHTAELIVLNKPPRVVCHPSRQGPWSSIVGACRLHFGVDRIHMPSRLDRDTSGVLVLATTTECGRRLQHAVGRGQVRKTYTAILDGHLSEAVLVEAPIGCADDPGWYSRQAVAPDGRPSRTEFVPLQHAEGFTLVRVHPYSGRRHQIRVHAAHIGHPVAGDKLYGPDPSILPALLSGAMTDADLERLPLPRHALHASEIVFRAGRGEEIFSAPLFEDLERFWSGLVQAGR